MNNDRPFSSDELLKVLSLSHNATAIHTSDLLTVQTANDAMLDIWGKDRSVIGLPLEEALPELKGQPFLGMMQAVLRTGITHRDTDTPADLVVNGRLQTFYFDFEYRAIKNEQGETYCLLHTATDVTQRYLNQQSLLAAQKTQEALAREQALNEELASANEELSAINEELNDTQQLLQQLNAELEDRVASRTVALAESEANFRNLMLQAPVALGLFTGPDMVLDVINDKFLELWDRDRTVIGKPIAEVLPELTDQPYIDLMKRVYTTNEPYHGIEAPVKLMRNGQIEEGYFTFINQPFKDLSGATVGVVVVASEVTDQVQAANRVKASEQRLSNMVMNTPISMAILEGRDLVIGVANQSMLHIWGRTTDQVLGRKLMDVFPELVGQPFPEMLQGVLDTGKGVALPEIEVDIDTPEGMKHYYVDFSYDPLMDACGKVEAIMVTVINITEIVEARKRLEQSEAEQQALNEEITASNEELAATNEELYATNEELGETQNQLKDIIADLEESEARMRYMLADAPISIAMLAGPNMVIEAANKKVLEAWGKTTAVIGKPLVTAIPELQGQEFLGILDNVFKTGTPFHGNEVKALLEQNGKIEEVYSNFVYQPIKDTNGQVTGIVLVANVVTEQVVARKKVEQAEENTRFAIEAANVGTWFLNVETREFIVSGRLKEQFGYRQDEEVTYQMIIDAIPEEYKEKVHRAVEEATSKGDSYFMEHPIIGYHDQARRWVRAYGKLYPDENGKLSHFSGLIIDVTEQKQDEMRKNDFIGMVSHELKTPLTSLSAYTQMLYNKARNNDDSFTAGALEKVNTQVKKMSTMINGFLNVSRLESGKIVLNKQEFRADELAQEMINDTLITAGSHSITLNYAEPIMVNADKDKIASVISNLLSNAIKYSPRGKSIQVACRRDGNMARFSVTDEGMGVKPHDIEKIFDRYYRVESSHTQTISGFGIGLYLCAEIVQRHDGRIWLESGIGKGSTFYFTLPVN